MKTDNELIAEFMDWKLDTVHGQKGAWRPTATTPDFVGLYSLELFNTSWDWLMPVVEKIEHLGFDNAIFFDGLHKINERNDFIIYQKQGGASELIRMKDNTKIKSVYRGVVRFIKWYNQEKSNLKE